MAHNDSGPQSVYHTVNTGSVDWKDAGLAQFAVNALVIANQSNWENEFRRLMDQVHQLNLMPNTLKCILGLFEASGFIHQPGVKEWITVSDVVSYMNENCHDGQIALVKADHKYPFMAIVPHGYSSYGPVDEKRDSYHCYGLLCDPGYYISDIWIRWADGQDHSPVKRRRRNSTGKAKNYVPPSDHEAFHYLQKNPKERIGDCVIRAFAGALDISWNEAMDRITAASGNANTTVNIASVYTKLLEQECFTRRSPMRKHGKKLTGKEFCRELDKVLLNGERVFAYVGRCHVAAVLPFIEMGKTHYKIVDGWDSSDRLIGEYWIKEPTRQEGLLTVEKEVSAGTYITHPIFGRGRVQSVHHSGWISIDFPKGGFRVLDCRWVKHHCVIEGPSGA